MFLRINKYFMNIYLRNSENIQVRIILIFDILRYYLWASCKQLAGIWEKINVVNGRARVGIISEFKNMT